MVRPFLFFALLFGYLGFAEVSATEWRDLKRVEGAMVHDSGCTNGNPSVDLPNGFGECRCTSDGALVCIPLPEPEQFVDQENGSGSFLEANGEGGEAPGDTGPVVLDDDIRTANTNSIEGGVWKEEFDIACTERREKADTCWGERWCG